MEEPKTALSIEDLTIQYEKTPVLKNITLKVPSGYIVGILGPNGAGKSTLLQAALGLLKPLSGTIRFFGQPLKSVRSRIAYIPQRQAVDWDFPLTVRELVLMGRYGSLGVFRRAGKQDWQIADKCIELVGLTNFKDRQISQLSGGQQQRAFLARALCQEADIYFMDEPFTGIDLTTETIMMNILRELKAQGKTVFIVHHDLNTADEYFDWVIMLNGHLIASGNMQEAFNTQNLLATYGKVHPGLFP